MTDFNALLEAELDRYARQWEKTEERLHAQIAILQDKLLELRQVERNLGDHGARGFPCPHCSKPLTICLKHGPYARTDENQCPACRRGE